MSNYDIYGFKNINLDKGKQFVETVLNIKLEAHDSLYQGGEYYKHGEKGGENFILKQNIDPFDDYELVEPDFTEYTVLLYVNNTDRSFELQSILNNPEWCHLLKSEYL